MWAKVSRKDVSLVASTRSCYKKKGKEYRCMLRHTRSLTDASPNMKSRRDASPNKGGWRTDKRKTGQTARAEQQGLAPYVYLDSS